MTPRASHLHVRLEIVFASAAEGTQRTLVAFQTRVNHHVSLPVALAFDDQAAHGALKGLPAVLRRTCAGKEKKKYYPADPNLYECDTATWRYGSKSAISGRISVSQGEPEGGGGVFEGVAVGGVGRAGSLDFVVNCYW